MRRVESAALQATREGGELWRRGRAGTPEKQEPRRQGGPVGGRWRAVTGTTWEIPPEKERDWEVGRVQEEEEIRLFFVPSLLLCNNYILVLVTSIFSHFNP
jgi:hypothetical protein